MNVLDERLEGRCGMKSRLATLCLVALCFQIILAVIVFVIYPALSKPPAEPYLWDAAPMIKRD